MYQMMREVMFSCHSGIHYFFLNDRPDLLTTVLSFCIPGPCYSYHSSPAAAFLSALQCRYVSHSGRKLWRRLWKRNMTEGREGHERDGTNRSGQNRWEYTAGSTARKEGWAMSTELTYTLYWYPEGISVTFAPTKIRNTVNTDLHL